MEQDLRIDAILPDLQGKSIALNSDISFNSNLIIVNYILDGLKNDEVTCIVTFKRSSTDIIDSLSALSEESALLVSESIMNEKLVIIDAYSFRSGKIKEEIPGVVFLESSDDLTMLSIAMDNVSRQYPQMRFVMWPLSLLALFTEVKSLTGFMQTQIARVASRKQLILFVLDRGVLESRETAIIESLLDGVLETKIEVGTTSTEMFRIKFYQRADISELSSWITIG